jgi:hypothetical protein
MPAVDAENLWAQLIGHSAQLIVRSLSELSAISYELSAKVEIYQKMQMQQIN